MRTKVKVKGKVFTSKPFQPMAHLPIKGRRGKESTSPVKQQVHGIGTRDFWSTVSLIPRRLVITEHMGTRLVHEASPHSNALTTCAAVIICSF